MRGKWVCHFQVVLMRCGRKILGYWRWVFWPVTVPAMGLVCAGVGMLSAADELSRYIVDGRRSGYTYLSEENQRLQNDDFANPGLLWVERGRELWGQVDAPTAKSCASCHGEAADSM